EILRRQVLDGAVGVGDDRDQRDLLLTLGAGADAGDENSRRRTHRDGNREKQPDCANNHGRSPRPRMPVARRRTALAARVYSANAAAPPPAPLPLARL